MPTSTLDSPDGLSRYDRTTIVLHWTTAFLVAVLWLSAQVIDAFPRGPARVDARSVHMLLGVVLAIVLALRLVWRSVAGTRLAPAGTGSVARLATLVHFALYALVLAAIAVGVLNAWVRGESVFNLLTIPAFDPGNRALRRAVGGIHETLANAILVVAGLHAAAALLHHYVWKDDVLRRMLPVPVRRD